MRTWRPPSWSQQAREFCDSQVEYINTGHLFIEEALYILSNAPCPPIVRSRAVKRFGRLMKAGKIKENKEEFVKNYPLEAKARGFI